MGPILVALLIGLAAPHSFESLVTAVRRGDPTELDRLARRLGPVELRRALGANEIDVELAALELAPRVEAAWAVLPMVARLVESREESVAVAALRASQRIALELDWGSPEYDEVPRDLVREVMRQLAGTARNATLPAERRSATLALLPLLRPLAPLPLAILMPLLGDAAPEVRRTTVDVLAREAAATDALVELLGRETEAPIAGGAAAAVCSRLPPTRTAEWRRIRALVLDPRTLPADAVEICGCLASGTPEDRARLAEAARSHEQRYVKAAAEKAIAALAETPHPSVKPAPPTQGTAQNRP